MHDIPRIVILLAATILGLATLAPARWLATVENAQEETPQDKPAKRWTPAEARAAIESFDRTYERTDYELPILEELDKSKAVRDLAKVDHRLVAKRLLSLLREDREKIWEEAVAGLAEQKASAGFVAPYLMKMFDPNTAPPGRTVRLLRTLAELQAKQMVDECVKLFPHEEDAVALAAVEALGKIGDRTVLPKLRDLYELNHLDPSRGISVRVDTGSAGSADARAARAAGQRREKMRRIPIRKEILAVIEEALFRLTGEKLKTPEELAVWMEKNKKLWR